MRRTSKIVPALLAVTGLLLAGCGNDSSNDSASSTTAAGSATSLGGSTPTSGLGLDGTITISAAASLTGAFTQIGDDFAAANPGTEATLNFSSSSTLSAQILDGAPADVYASADEKNMTLLTDATLIAGEPKIFARNELVIVTKPGNPEGITGLADLADVGVVALCGEEAPCGKYAKQALDGAGVSIPESNVTRGEDAKTTLTAVAEGDAVAGVVYVTDAASVADSVEAVTIPADQNVMAVYPIGIIAGSGNADVAEAFMQYVLSAAGKAVLEGLGFLPPA